MQFRPLEGAAPHTEAYPPCQKHAMKDRQSRGFHALDLGVRPLRSQPAGAPADIPSFSAFLGDGALSAHFETLIRARRDLFAGKFEPIPTSQPGKASSH